MVARNFSLQEIPYSRLLQIPEDDRDFITLEELKPVIHQRNIQQYNPSTFYELSNISNNPSSSNGRYPENMNLTSAMEFKSDSTAIISSRKRKMSYHDTSDPDDDNAEDAKSIKANDENKKQNHSEIEKRRRDKMNTYITELSAMIPMCHAMSRKLDKLTVLRMAVQHLKTIRGAVHSYTEGHYKPSFISDQELKHLILQATDGFLFVVGCDRGRILYVSESVSKFLHYSQGDLLGQSLFDILHPKDVAKAKEQLSSSDLNPRERLIDAKTMLPVKADVPQGGSRLCPGARRSFFCRMKCKSSSQVKEEADTTTGCHKRKKQQNLDKKYSLIHCTGYLKSWTPTKIGLEDQENDGENDSCNLSCLVAVGRVLPHISIIAATTQSKPHVHPVEFISRHTLDGKFLFVDQRATLVLGFLQQELLGSSMYEYYHHDDITVVAECHKCALQSNHHTTTKTYRFRTKSGGFVKLQSEWRSFKNPWTKDVEYFIAKNTLILTDIRTVESSASGSNGIQENMEIFTKCEKDIQQLISTHVEASKIGRQIAEQVLDSQRRGIEISSNDSPNSEIDSQLLVSSAENLITTSTQPESTSTIVDACQSRRVVNQIRNNISLSNVIIEPCSVENTDGGITEVIEDAVIGSPGNEPVAEGNDEAAMAVIMSLLEADTGLGGPVDFSGLPWPLP